MIRIRSIRARIALLTGGLITLIFLGLGIFLYVSLNTQLQRAINDNLAFSAEQLLVLVEYENGQWRFDIGDLAVANVSDDVVRLVSPSGVLLDDRSEYQVPIPAQTLRGDGGLFTVRYADAGDEAAESAKQR